ncbi:hypothetical protein Zmor_007382 [Zophobas morio]|uniref:Uncharacterized protein n=1 Tax=Zophobas morio TaxID=2755281 RepID=A0AA38IRX8_9CUCU|nr:hypothetical protein Zmor_007382 [Zophobas morio]
MLAHRPFIKAVSFSKTEKHYSHKRNIKDAITVILTVERKAAVNCQLIVLAAGSPGVCSSGHVGIVYKKLVSLRSEESFVFGREQFFGVKANDGAKRHKSPFF